MPYSHTTFGTAKTLLAQRGGNSTFWTNAELGLYIVEALRIFGSLTGYWRERGSFATTSGTAHYSLSTLIPTLLGQSVTDRNLIQEMQYHFLENASDQSAWLGTDMFTLNDLRYALQRSRDQFLVDSGCVLTRSTWNMPPPPTATVQLDDSVIDVRRASWRSLPSFANIQSVAIHPSTTSILYVGTSDGGIYKSTTSGATWAVTNNGITNLFISALVINPSTPAIVYAGSYGGGAFKSTNSGTTWTAIITGLTSTNVSSMVINPATPTTLYAGTYDGGVFKSTDSGATWTAINTGLTNTSVASLAINQTTPSILYAGTLGGGVFRSADSGATWAAVNTGLTLTNILALAINPVTPTTLYAGGSGGVFKTTNSGAAWAAVNTGLTSVNVQALAADATLVTPILYAGTVAGVFKSTDSGANWALASTGITTLDISVIATDPVTASNVYAGTNGGGIFRSVDTAAKWIADAVLSSYLLWRTDTWQESSVSQYWGIDPGTPEDWMLNDTRPVEIRVSPPPIDVGTLELVTVNAGAALNPASAATAVGLPDSLAWAAKWGAISDLLSSESQASDPQRSQFAGQLYQMAVEIALKLPTVIYQEINGLAGFPCALADIDAAYQNWQAVTGTPEDVGIAGPNLVFVRPVPDGVYSIVLDVVRNAPIPMGDSEYLQVGREELNAILDIAQAIAAFKQGGTEFTDALTQAQDAFRSARVYVRRMNANILTLNTLAGLATREDVLRPRIAAEVVA